MALECLNGVLVTNIYIDIHWYHWIASIRCCDLVWYHWYRFLHAICYLEVVIHNLGLKVVSHSGRFCRLKHTSDSNQVTGYFELCSIDATEINLLAASVLGLLLTTVRCLKRRLKKSLVWLPCKRCLFTPVFGLNLPKSAITTMRL